MFKIERGTEKVNWRDGQADGHSVTHRQRHRDRETERANLTYREQNIQRSRKKQTGAKSDNQEIHKDLTKQNKKKGVGR